MLSRRLFDSSRTVRGSEIGPSSKENQGSGLSATTQLWTYQKPPDTTSAPVHSTADSRRERRNATTSTPMPSTATGARTVSLVPSESPAATPASATGAGASSD